MKYIYIYIYIYKRKCVCIYIYTYIYIYMKIYKTEKIQTLQRMLLFTELFANVKRFIF